LILKGAKEVTSLVTPYGTTYPGMTCYDNRLGGRIYVFAGNGSLGDGFFSNYRVTLWKEICSDISDQKIFSINNGSYALLSVKSKGEESAVLITNMCADQMEDITIHCPYPVKQAVVIDSCGKEYVPTMEGNIIYCSNLNLQLYECLICKING